MERHEWYCPQCHTFHREYLNEWKTTKCKSCFTEVTVNYNGNVIRVSDRYNDYGSGIGMGNGYGNYNTY